MNGRKKKKDKEKVGEIKKGRKKKREMKLL